MLWIVIRWVLVATTAIVFCTVNAAAADKLFYGPPPAWVNPTPITTSALVTDTPLRILLIDGQINLSKPGQSAYQAVAQRAETEQGLAAMGTVAVRWRPNADRMTIHSVKIQRGSQTIDVLAGGHKFLILRREDNLEAATLDGVLTATLQVEGLQIGDVLVTAYTLDSIEPTVRGHSESSLVMRSPLPIERFKVRAFWPEDKKIRWRASEGLPPIEPIRHNGIVEITLDMHDFAPYIAPEGAPSRYYNFPADRIHGLCILGLNR